jgi:ParB family chromosome partitioning protein
MRRRGLGRGLSDLIPGAQQAERGTGTREIAVEDIRPNPYQPRTEIDQQSLEELAQSIRENGVIQPVLVREREGYYELVAGERRWRAARMAGLSAVPGVVRNVSEVDMVKLALVENLQREDVNPMDAARSYHRLAGEFGMTHEQIADAVGKSRAAVTNTLRLLSLPGGVQEDVRNTVISEGHARALLPLVGTPELEVMWSRVVAEQPSVRELERWTKAALKPKRVTKGKESVVNPAVAEMQARLERAIGSRVNVVYDEKRRDGRIEIFYHSWDDLERLFLFLTRT